jgi:hypothetical protein
MKAAIVVGALVVALPLAAGADELYLRSGGHLSGVVVEQRPDAVVIDVGAGRVTLPAALVLRVVEGTPSFAIFRDRADRLGDADVTGWLALAAWARDHDLLTQARQAFEHVLTVDPGNAVAHRELGHVQLEGHWMTAEESYRARGYVYFEGTWITPEERAGLIADRAAEAQARQAEIEAEARIREADARARAAEAEARRAEGTYADGGIPLSMTYGAPYAPYGTYGPVVVYGAYGYGGLGSGRSHGRGSHGSGSHQGPSCAPGQGPTGTPPPTQAPPPPHRDSVSSRPPTRSPAGPASRPGPVPAPAGVNVKR